MTANLFQPYPSCIPPSRRQMFYQRRSHERAEQRGARPVAFLLRDIIVGALEKKMETMMLIY